MSEPSLQNLQSGPERAKVGHCPLSSPNSLQDNQDGKWAIFQPETHTREDTCAAEASADGGQAALLECWRRSQLREGYAAKTVKQLRSGLRQLFRYLEENALTVLQVGYPQAQGYLEWLHHQPRHYADWTLCGYLDAASSFFRFLKAEGLVREDPFGELEGPRLRRTFPRTILKEAQMQRLLEELGRFDEGRGIKQMRRRYRVHLIAELQYSTGMRIDEVAHLRQEDVDLDDGSIEVRHGKGGRSRRVFLNDYAREVLRLYLEKMRAVVMESKGDETLVFAAGVQSLMRLMRQELPLATGKLGYGKLRSHDFRHAFAFHLLRSGCDVRSIQELLGHRLLRSTEVYTRVEREDLKAVLDNYHPRKWGGAADGRPD